MCVGHSKVFKVEKAVGVILSNQLDEAVGWLVGWLVPGLGCFNGNRLVNEFIVFFSTNALGRPSLDGG